MSICLSIFVLFIAIIVIPYRSAFLSVFVPIQFWDNILPTEKQKCSPLDEDVFRKKLIPVPSINVNSHKECSRIGRQMNHPLMCIGDFLDVPNASETILDDPTVYNLHCYDTTKSLQSLLIFSQSSSRRNATLRGLLEEHPDCYAPFVHGEAHYEQIKKILPDVDSAVKKTEGQMESDVIKEGKEVNVVLTFISNLIQSQMTAALHAAPAEAVVMQLVGEKTWIMQKNVPTPLYPIPAVTFNYPECASDYMERAEDFWIAKTKPGTYLYFPSFWRHAVYTGEGFNVMANLRTVSKAAVWRAVSWVDLIGFSMRLVAGLVANSGRKPVKANQNRDDVPFYLWNFKAYHLFEDQAATDTIKTVLESL